MTIAVRLFAAVDQHDLRFHHVHRADAGRIQHRRVCASCGEEVDAADVTKSYELDDGRMVLLEQEDFERLPSPTSHTIDVVQFVSPEDIDPIYYRRSYYLEPDDAAVQAYVLLRQALERARRMAIVRITVRQREMLATLHTRGDLLVLHTMLWPDEIRVPDFAFLDRDVTVRPAELTMATSLVATMSAPFTPGEFADRYRDALAGLIEAKAAGADLPAIPEPRDADTHVDLATALRDSIDQARATRT
nr:Ku protein [Solihabitans fulvus]